MHGKGSNRMDRSRLDYQFRLVKKSSVVIHHKFNECVVDTIDIMSEHHQLRSRSSSIATTNIEPI